MDLQSIEEKTAQTLRAEDDYPGADGLLYCGKCRTAKQIRIRFDGEEQSVYCMCACMEREYERMMKEKRRNEMQYRIDRNRQNAFGYCGDHDAKLHSFTFSADDGKNASLSKICRRYAERFHSGIKWLVLYGKTDAGKTFGAACIANQLLEEGYSVRFVTASQVEKRLWDARIKSEIYGELSGFDLLVLDDLGSERSSEYMDEIVFNILDDRLRSGKPMIITTNINLTEIRDENRMQKQRIYSRLCERSAFFLCEEMGRRRTNARMESAAFIRELLNDEKF